MNLQARNKKCSGFILSKETAIEGIPNTQPSIAPATVPLYRQSVPILYPLLAPERIKSGLSFTNNPSIAILQQSAVIPPQENTCMFAP